MREALFGVNSPILLIFGGNVFAFVPSEGSGQVAVFPNLLCVSTELLFDEGEEASYFRSQIYSQILLIMMKW